MQQQNEAYLKCLQCGDLISDLKFSEALCDRSDQSLERRTRNLEKWDSKVNTRGVKPINSPTARINHRNHRCSAKQDADLLTNKFVEFWYLLISRKATTPGLHRRFCFTTSCILISFLPLLAARWTPFAFDFSKFSWVFLPL